MITIYAHCKHEKCKTFVIRIGVGKNEAFKTLWSTSIDFSHDPSIRLTNYIGSQECKLLG